MRLSVIIAVLNSHEIVKRQIEHFSKIDLPREIEVIIVDDGSNPPLKCQVPKLLNLSVYYTNDKRPWTQGLARNLGASKSKGEYLLFTDIDHILTEEAIDSALCFTGDKLVFPRYYGILNESGDIVCDEKSMVEFGLDPARVRTQRGHLCAGIHGNTYSIKRSIFDRIGGYDARYCQSMFHVGGRYTSEESKFNSAYLWLIRNEGIQPPVIGPKIYFYPVGKFRADRNNNPFGLFHGLSLEQTPQPMME